MACLVEDITRLSRIPKEENPYVRFILMAHSMGLFLSRQYILDHSYETEGLILSGSGALEGLARLTNSAPAGSNILNACFEPARTPVHWLSRNDTVVDAFIRDPLGFPQLLPGFFASFHHPVQLVCTIFHTILILADDTRCSTRSTAMTS